MDGRRVIFRHIVVPCAVMFAFLGFALFLLFNYPMIFAGLLLMAVLWGVITGIQSKKKFKQKGYRAGHKGRDEIFYEEWTGQTTREILIGGELTVDAPFIVYVPNDEEWKRKIPDWARERKTEILNRIKEELGTSRHQFMEY